MRTLSITYSKNYVHAQYKHFSTFTKSMTIKANAHMLSMRIPWNILNIRTKQEKLQQNSHVEGHYIAAIKTRNL